MAVTQNTYTGNGSTTLYSFTFPYLKEEDIKVALNGTLTTAYTFANATTISFPAAPANGVSIRIYRDTNIDSLQSTFFAGSAIRAGDLNNNFLQSNYLAQELRSRSIDPNSAIFTGTVNFGNFKGINLANGTNAGDAVNKAQLDASQNYNDAQLASSVAAATTQAGNAAASASSAASQAASATTQANNAAAAAQTANTAAGTATTQAANAAASAATAAAFAGNTIFFGFARNQYGNLILTYSSPAENTTYPTSDYEYKGGSQWYIGSNDILYTSGPLIGTPKVSFNASGHLILTA
jgi:hypothetical protein